MTPTATTSGNGTDGSTGREEKNNLQMTDTIPPQDSQGLWFMKAEPAPGYPLTGQALEAAKERGRASGVNFEPKDKKGTFHDTGHEYVSARVVMSLPEDEWVDC
jgi:hypothetical protein